MDHTLPLKYKLLARRRFLPLFAATFLGSFNDNLLRSGLVVLIAYSASRGVDLPISPEILVTICSALLILPLLIFSSLAGALADKFEKSKLVIAAKAAEVGIMLISAYGFATDDIYLLMAMLFVSGTHTAFYGPIKYSLLPEHLAPGELLAANGFMASGGFLAVLLGMITGGWLVMMPHNVIGMTAIGIAVIGLIASLFIPGSQPAHPEADLRFNLWKSSCDLLRYIWSGDTVIVRAILALSWFLVVGSVYMAQFPNYAQGSIGGDHYVYIVFLTVFSIGLSIGSVLCDRLLRGEISARLVPFAAAGVSLFTALIVWLTPPMPHAPLLTVGEFLSHPTQIALLACMLGVSICGGLYMVPLYAILQSRAPQQYRSRVMAASNFSDSVLMTLAALISIALLAMGVGVTGLFVILALINVGVVFYARRLVS